MLASHRSSDSERPAGRPQPLWMLRAVMLWLVWFGTMSPSFAQRVESLPSALEGVGVDEHAGDTLPLDLPFKDHRGQVVTLRQFFQKQRPVIFTLNYSNCPMLCNLQLTGLTEGLQELEWSAGTEFEVVSLSIDPLETPERAAQTQQRYLQMYGRPGTGSGWHFLVGKQESIDQVAKAIGFQYRYVRERREYSHPAVFVMCTPDGRIGRYVYGIQFSPRTLQLSLVEAGQGEIGTTWDRVLLYCLHYDSTTGQYTPAAWKIMRAGGVITLAGVLGLMAYYFRRERRLRLVLSRGDTLVPA
ncbi:MAG: hypothetical protein B7Z55_04695 [Planctomycetales bacterium 12-60-4]|nr:MAG: hypothetical protein B7Z55_04695 [Planctomycetales bacterium 12-60-4]